MLASDDCQTSEPQIAVFKQRDECRNARQPTAGFHEEPVIRRIEREQAVGDQLDRKQQEA